ncbi:hypothetical protein MCOR25_010233 [Pyricularia grisea]|nr:hypothetical protein MCOR25_010233 [Pyricularia grisea]
MVANCNKFHFTESGETCANVASKNGISLADFLPWNRAVGNNCAGLWANAQACVGLSAVAARRVPLPLLPAMDANALAYPG